METFQAGLNIKNEPTTSYKNLDEARHDSMILNLITYLLSVIAFYTYPKC